MLWLSMRRAREQPVAPCRRRPGGHFDLAAAHYEGGHVAARRAVLRSPGVFHHAAADPAQPVKGEVAALRGTVVVVDDTRLEQQPRCSEHVARLRQLLRCTEERRQL